MAANETAQWQKRQAEKRARRERRKKKQSSKRDMSDAARLLRAVLNNLSRLYPNMLAENLLTLAMLVTGILGLCNRENLPK
jgi:hypothetical protein